MYLFPNPFVLILLEETFYLSKMLPTYWIIYTLDEKTENIQGD